MKDVQMIDIGNPREVAAAAESAVWFHSIDLGHGVVTKGQKTAPALAGELEALRLPGKHLAHRVLGSRAEPVVQDFMLADPQTIGTFDVVLFLGVLYHTQNPLVVLQKVASLTRETVVIEPEAMEVPGAGDMLLCELFPSNELNGDYSNWWAPNMRALQGLVRAAGLKRVEVIQGPPSMTGVQPGSPPVRYRAMMHAHKS